MSLIIIDYNNALTGTFKLISVLVRSYFGSSTNILEKKKEEIKEKQNSAKVKFPS
jgi:hypothetical protein